MSWNDTNIQQMQFEEIKKKDIETKDLQKENQELKRKLDLAVRALEYYAETENWYETGYEDSRSKTEGDGGKHARQALKEIKDEK